MTGRASPGAGTYARIYDVVRRIPRGRVATYGQVAELAGLAGHARQVGYALHALPEGTAVPWHRVINAAGALSPRAVPGETLAQRQRLEAEGVAFDLRGRVSLAAARWRPARRPGAGAAARRAGTHRAGTHRTGTHRTGTHRPGAVRARRPQRVTPERPRDE